MKVEVLAVALVILLGAGSAHRPDLAMDGCVLVIGLHSLAMARIFRAPKLAVLGILIAIWCIVCVALLRWNALVIAVTTGTGFLLWVTAVAVLLWAGSAARELRGCRRSSSGLTPPRAAIRERAASDRSLISTGDLDYHRTPQMH